MEEIVLYITQNWSYIVETAIWAVAYFLVFLYRAKVNGTKKTLTVLFKEKAAEVTSTDINLRQDVKKIENKMEQELEDAKAAYEDAVDQIADLKSRLAKAEKALLELITDTEEVATDGVHDPGTN